MVNKVVMEWFDGLEATLETESKLSGLLDHNPTIGQAREFLVRRVLKTILQANVHIGSGKVIDHNERTSKQIDIIVYDSRFPMLELEGGGLYFVEGGFATIEVKSTMDSEQLAGSLDNCKGAGYPDDVLGITLMRKAFHPETGPLTDLSRVAGEREAEMHLFSGNWTR
jgi:hypothetical protein